MGRQQGSEAVPQAVSMAGGPRAPGLQPPHQAALFPPLAHLLEGMMPVQNGQHQGCDPTPPRAPRGRRGRDEAIAQRGAFQASSDTKHQRHMCHRMHRLDGHGPDAPPVGTLTRPPPRPQQSHGRAGGAFRTKKRVVQPNPLNLRWVPCGQTFPDPRQGHQLHAGLRRTAHGERCGPCRPIPAASASQCPWRTVWTLHQGRSLGTDDHAG